MENLTNKIKSHLKNKNYEEALEETNLAISVSPSNELFFYKAYILGELNSTLESIEIYKSLLEKETDEKYLHGICRTLDKRNLLDENLVEYYIRLNELKIDDKRRNLNNERILNYWLNDSEKLFENLTIIIEKDIEIHGNHYENIIQPSHPYVYIQKGLNDKIKEIIKKLYTMELNFYRESNAIVEEIQILEKEYIRNKRVELYRRRSLEYIIKLNNFEFLLYKIGNLYVNFSLELFESIKSDLKITFDTLNSNLIFQENEIAKIYNESKMKSCKIKEENYYEIDHIEASDFICKNSEILLLFFQDYEILTNKVVNRKYKLNISTYLPDQIFFSSSILLFLNENINFKEILTFYKNYNYKTNEYKFYQIEELYKNGLMIKCKKECEMIEFFNYKNIEIYFDTICNSNMKFDIDLVLSKLDQFMNYNFGNASNQTSEEKVLIFLKKISGNKNSEETEHNSFVIDKNSYYNYVSILTGICYMFYKLNNLIFAERFLNFFDENSPQKYFLKSLIEKENRAKYLKIAHETSPENYIFCEEIGHYYYLEKNKETALEYYLKSNLIKRKILSKIDFSTNQKYDEEELHYLLLDANAVVKTAKCLFELHNLDKSISFLESNPRYCIEYDFYLASLYYQAERYNNSEICALSSLNKKETFNTLLLLGRICNKTQRYEASIEYFNKAGVMNPIGHLEKAKILVRLKKYIEAIDILKSIKEDSKNALFNECILFEKLKAMISIFKNTGQWKTEIEKILEINFNAFNDEVGILKSHFEIYASLHFKHEMRILQKITLDTISNNTNAILAMKQKTYDIARDFLYRDENNFKGLLLQALCFYKDNMHKESLLCLQKAKFIQNESALYHIAHAYITKKNINLAIEHIIEEYEPIYHDILTYFVLLAIKECKEIKQPAELILLYNDRNLNLIETQILGILYFITGELNKAKKLLNEKIFKEVYTKNINYIEGFILMNYEKFTDALDKITKVDDLDNELIIKIQECIDYSYSENNK